jgi:hypothetical protein
VWSKRDEVRDGVVGAIAVLKFREKMVTISNLSAVLSVSPSAVEAYLKEHPQIDLEVFTTEPEAAQ